MNVTLIDGLTLGKDGNEATHRDVVIKELTAGDMMDAEMASERVVETVKGPSLVRSPSRMTYEMMRRAVVSLGPIQGPISLAELGKLTPTDFELLNAAIFDYQGLSVSGAIEGQGR